MGPGRSLIDRFYELLGAGDVAGLTGLYGEGAEIVRFDEVAATSDGIAAYLDAFLRRHRNCSLRSIDQFRETDDVVMWDEMLDTPTTASCSRRTSSYSPPTEPSTDTSPHARILGLVTATET